MILPVFMAAILTTITGRPQETTNALSVDLGPPGLHKYEVQDRLSEQNIENDLHTTHYNTSHHKWRQHSNNNILYDPSILHKKFKVKTASLKGNDNGRSAQDAVGSETIHDAQQITSLQDQENEIELSPLQGVLAAPLVSSNMAENLDPQNIAGYEADSSYTEEEASESIDNTENEEGEGLAQDVILPIGTNLLHPYHPSFASDIYHFNPNPPIQHQPVLHHIEHALRHPRIELDYDIYPDDAAPPRLHPYPVLIPFEQTPLGPFPN